MLDFYVKTRIRFCLRDRRLFEITEVEILRVDCIRDQTDFFCLWLIFLTLETTEEYVYFLQIKQTSLLAVPTPSKKKVSTLKISIAYLIPYDLFLFYPNRTHKGNDTTGTIYGSNLLEFTYSTF